MHEVKVDIVQLQVGQGLGDALFDTLVPRVVKLSSNPDLVAWYT